MKHMKIHIPAFALIIFALASSCEDVGISDDNSAATAYSYTAFDARGNTVTRGTLWLDLTVQQLPANGASTTAGRESWRDG